MDDNLTNFMAITGADANAAQFYVEAAGGNVELAVANFFDGGGGGGGGFGGGGFGGGGGSGAVGGGFDAMVDDVDAATSRGGDGSGSPRTPAEEGEAARAQGKAELKWLLVVITNEQVFGCHQMNRDVWADETVQAVVEASFVLWLRPHTDPAAVTPSPVDPSRRSPPLAPAPPPAPPPPFAGGAVLGGGAGSAFAAPPPARRRFAAPRRRPRRPRARALGRRRPLARARGRRRHGQFRLPNGAKKRRFEPSDTVAALFKFAAEASQTTGLFDLRCGFPPRQLWPQKDLTLEEAKVHGEAIQMKQG
ncbi:ubiquitin binding protein [Aureococcus anophagefferens]|nr:ubiquitin binding protein [Aureococcus anophagefferens]